MITTLTCDADGMRLDVYLAQNIPALTRSAAARLIDSGNVTVKASAATVTAQIAKKNRKTVCGEIYEVIQNEPEVAAAVQQDIRLDIVFEDKDVIVINKPRGMVVHPAPGHSSGTLVNALLYHCGDSLSGIGGQLRPGIVHRLDKDTSGLIIAAKNDAAHISLSKQLSNRTLKRQYDTIVHGNLKNNAGIIDAPIGRHPADRKKQAVIAAGMRGKSRYAVTHYKVISRYDKYTHIECILETGRTHQIRVHMAHIGHPILGDAVYNRRKNEFGMTSQCLHARSLCFIHPASDEPMELTSQLPQYFADILNKLKVDS